MVKRWFDSLSVMGDHSSELGREKKRVMRKTTIHAFREILEEMGMLN